MFLHSFHGNEPSRGQLSLSLTIWLVKWTAVSKVNPAMVHRDPVNITAALICNGRHFVRLIVRWGVTGCVLPASARMYLALYVGSGGCVQMTEVRYARIAARIVPLKYSPVKGASPANCALARVFERTLKVSVSPGSGNYFTPSP